MKKVNEAIILDLQESIEAKNIARVLETDFFMTKENRRRYEMRLTTLRQRIQSARQTLSNESK